MASQFPQPETDQLLKHVPWMKRLARDLLRDSHLADDVVQDALQSYLEKPPTRLRSLSRWLASQ